MPSQPAIPALLSPLLQTPPKACSLSLLTSVLSTSTNWLVLRFIYGALAEGEKSLNNNNSNNDDDDDGTKTTGEFRVLIISWLRGLELWREMGKKLGVDFSRGGGDKLAFLDGLGSANFGAGGGGGGGGGVREVEREILNAVQRLKQNDGGGQQRRVLVILDGVDFLAAAMGAEVTELMDMVTEIREVRFHFHFLSPFFLYFFFPNLCFMGEGGVEGKGQISIKIYKDFFFF